MKINSDVIWAVSLVVLGFICFYIGNRVGRIEAGREYRSENEEQQAEIENLLQKNNQLSEELTSRGIYSYPQATIIPEAKDSQATVLITLNGNDPVKNLEIRRKVFYDYSKKGQKELKDSGNISEPIFLGTLKSHNPATFDIPLTKEEIALVFQFESKKNQWKQHIRLKRLPDGTVKSFWVITNGESEVIDKHIDQGFPTDPDGNIVFWEDRKLKYSEIELNSRF